MVVPSRTFLLTVLRLSKTRPELLLKTSMLIPSLSYAVFTNNVLTRSGGTSAACPVFAGAVALLNDARLAKGLKPLGFLNPFLYGAGATGFTDIMRGGAKGCTGVNAQTGATIPGASIIPYASWNATAGWDPVTGLGVPDFAKLLSLATAG